MSSRPAVGLDRRSVLIGSAGLLGAGALASTGARAQAAPVRALGRGVLGRTGMRVTDISFGSSRTQDPDVVRRAFERGINYFDTAESYRGGDAERAIGEALHDVRDQVFITSKTRAEAGTTRHAMMAALEASLRRLRSDYVDVYMNHAVNDVARMANPEWAEFTERAKQQGKIRWRGMSGHGARLAECVDHALDHGLVDVILTAYSFAQDPDFFDRVRREFGERALGGSDMVASQHELPPRLARARREGVGVVVMKTLMGGRRNDMTPYQRPGDSFAHAAFRWALSSPDVDALVVSMKDSEMVDDYLRASGTGAPREADLRLLSRYFALNSGRQCRQACGACLASCPAGVEVGEVLRTRMYAVDYGDPIAARAGYAAIRHDASPCLACSGAPCAGACPHGLPIADLTRDAAQQLG